MRKARRDVAAPALLAAVSFALAFAQRPGLISADTKINLHVDPGRFLGDAASMWSSSGQLGGVQAGQQVGYLFPMGPYFALGHALGVSDWVLQRLWLGLLLWLAAWGTVRLLDALLGGRNRVAALSAGAVVVLNPFVVTYANRTTVTLLAYVALPWLLLAVHRGLREPRAWCWPAAFALLVAASGGGVNGAVTAWMLLGPVLLALYEWRVCAVPGRAAGSFAVRAAALSLLVCLWWVIPAYVQASYGNDFLHFTEQPGTVWGTTSATESLRLMSFWLSYVGIGFSGRAIPYFDTSPALLFSLPVVLSSLLVPAAALGGFVWTRRWRYGPFFLGLALAAVLVMTAGFPEGTPLRHGLYFAYNHIPAVRFLRASYKAAPLLAIALACLGGVAASQAWERLGRSGRVLRLVRFAGAGAGVAVLALAAWPLVTGRAQDRQVSFHAVPAAWRQAAADLDAQLPRSSRALVLPGQLFAFYRWGGTVDPILPALSQRPVAVRSEVPYSDPRATDLLWTIDGLVHQQRLLPGQLAPLLSLIGACSVLSGTDDDLARSDAPPPADIAGELAAQPGFASPARSYGPLRRFNPSLGLGRSVSLPEVRRYDLPAARPIVRLEPRRQPVIVDGSAATLAAMAAFGALPDGRAVIYAGDLSATRLRSLVGQGAELVLGDSNRRQAFVAGSLEQDTGPVLPADESVSADGIILDPFGRDPSGETVAAFTGIRSVLAPASPQRVQFPEHAAFAAIDGSPATAWVADPSLGPGRRWLQVNFVRSRPVPYVELLPYSDAGGTVRAVQIAGRTFAVRPGWNRLSLGLSAAGSLRVAITSLSPPARGFAAGAGGIRELRIPGLHPAQSLALPRDGAAVLAGRLPVGDPVDLFFTRVTGDDPFRRDLAHGPWSQFAVGDAGDAELAMSRSFVLPAARRFAARAWVSTLAQAPDPALDRLLGYRGPVSASSSGRFEGEPRWRASSAFDGDPGTAWIGDWGSGSRPWLALRAPSAFVLSRLRLIPSGLPVRHATVVGIGWDGGASDPLPVGAGGAVALPHTVRTRGLRITVLSASGGVAGPGSAAVGIAEVRGLGGLRSPRSPSGPLLDTRCGVVGVRISGRLLRLRMRGSRAAFVRGDPLPASSCGAAVALGAGAQQLDVLPAPLAVDELWLNSGAASASAAPSPAGAVLDPGHASRAGDDGVRLRVSEPAWLVLGEGYNRGWRATCDGRSLGPPTPIDGYANGWPVQPGCTRVSFSFAPQDAATIGYLISALAGVACLLAVGWGFAWRRRVPAPGPPAVWPSDASPAPLAGFALLWRSVLAAALAAFVFGIPAGVAALMLVALMLWLGVGARALTLAAGVLLALVVPLLYVLEQGSAAGGNHYGYATDHMAAHWVGVAALCLLTGALWRTLSDGPPRPRGPAQAAGDTR